MPGALALVAALALIAACADDVPPGPAAPGSPTPNPAAPDPTAAADAPPGTVPRPPIPPPADDGSRRDVAYASGHERQRLDLFLPSGVAAVDAPAPVVVWVHGGGWTLGSKDDLPIRGWTDQGFAVASVSYRYATEGAAGADAGATSGTPMSDVATAVAFLHSHAAELGIDPDRIGLYGHSAGAHLAALTALTGGVPIAALLVVAGPHDLTATTLPLAAGTEDAVTAMLGGCDPRACPDRATAASPVHRVGPDAPPTLLVHGTADPIVDPGHSIALDDALRDAGAPSELVLIEGGDHDDLAVDTARTFFAARLHPGRTGS